VPAHATAGVGDAVPRVDVGGREGIVEELTFAGLHFGSGIKKRTLGRGPSRDIGGPLRLHASQCRAALPQQQGCPVVARW
jgi:hypothetical protein